MKAMGQLSITKSEFYEHQMSVFKSGTILKLDST